MYSRDFERGWGIFDRVSVSDGNPTPVRYFLSAGIGGNSPLASRPGDVFGIGWFHVGTTDAFGPLPRALLGTREGAGIEIYYNAQITPRMMLTPDFLILRPGAGAVADAACIGGLLLNMKF